MTPEEINALLRSVRDQKFRGSSQTRLDGQNAQRSQIIAKYANEEYKDQWHKANKSRWDDEQWREQHLQKMAEGRTQEVEEARIEASRNSEKRKQAMAERWADPEFRAKISKINSRPRTQAEKDYLSKINKGKKVDQTTIDKRLETLNQRAMNNQKINSQSKSIHTPDGVFHNIRLCAEKYSLAANTIRRRCISKNPKFIEWYYLD